MKSLFRVGVVPGPAYQGRKRLFEALSRLFPVEFEPYDSISRSKLSALLLFDQSLVEARAVARNGTAVCHFTTARSTNSSKPIPEVCCTSASVLDRTLRGQRLEETTLADFTPLAVSGDEVLASKGRMAFWCRGVVGEGLLHRVSGELPALGPKECLWHHYRTGNFAGLLPLLHFLREAGGDLGQQEPLRATFVFDDPDLSRFHYGCLDFTSLARHAAEHGYHAAIATVPVTAGRVDERLADLFRSHSRELSLLIHGNNHTYCELLKVPSPEWMLATLAQALRRIERMEHRFGLKVARVMEAPHGAMDCRVVPLLAALGYEAAIATVDLMLLHNPNTVWPAEFGMDIAEVMPGGLGIIPRLRMSSQWRTEVVLSGFLRKPMVLVGHHADAGNRMELMADFARLVNGFGPVEWGSLTDIARGNFRSFNERDGLRVKAYQRRLSVPVPPNVEYITVERHWVNGNACELLIVESADGKQEFCGTVGRLSPRIRVRAGSRLVVHSPIPHACDPHSVPSTVSSLWPITRRLMTETRDRTYPWFHLSRVRSPFRGATPICHD